MFVKCFFRSCPNELSWFFIEFSSCPNSVIALMYTLQKLFWISLYKLRLSRLEQMQQYTIVHMSGCLEIEQKPSNRDRMLRCRYFWDSVYCIAGYSPRLSLRSLPSESEQPVLSGLNVFLKNLMQVSDSWRNYTGSFPSHVWSDPASIILTFFIPFQRLVFWEPFPLKMKSISVQKRPKVVSVLAAIFQEANLSWRVMFQGLLVKFEIPSAD